MLATLVVALAVAACEGATASPGSASPLATAGTSDSPGSSSSDSPSDEPTVEPTESPTDEPTDEPTEEPTPTRTPGPSSSPSAGGTGACFGSADTRDFFDAFAQSVSWPVYCAVLPKGWSIETCCGKYHLANGGRLTLSYRRRSDGARILLDEGAVCAETNPCIPGRGSDLGTTAFSDRDAALSTIKGGYVAVVDATENPAWLLTGTDISQDDFAAIAAKLHLIDE